MDEHNRPRTEMMREVFRHGSGREFGAAIDTLVGGLGAESTGALAEFSKGGLVREVDDKEARFAAMAADYCHITGQERGDGRQYTSMILTATNADRRTLNGLVREQLVQEGRVDQGVEVAVMAPVNVSGVTGMRVDTYQPGDIIEPMVDTGLMLKGGKYAVAGLDRDNNRLIVTPKGKSGAEHEMVVDQTQQSGDWQVYRQEQRHVGVGDRLMYLRTDRDAELYNATTMEVVGVRDAKGAGGEYALLEVVVDGKNKTIDVREQNYFDHAYAGTVHKSQGTTIDAPIVNADPQMLNSAAFYTMTTRARDAVKVYTSNIDDLRVAAMDAQEKSSIYDIRGADGKLHENVQKVLATNPVDHTRPIEERYESVTNDLLKGMIVGPAVRGFVAETATAVLKNNERLEVKNFDGIPLDHKGRAVDPSVIRELHQTDGERLDVFRRHERAQQKTEFTDSVERKLELNAGRAASRTERGFRPANIIGAKGWDITAGGVGWQWDREGNKAFIVGHRESHAPGYAIDTRTRYIKSGPDQGSVMRTVTRESGVTGRWTRTETLTRANGEKSVATAEGYSVDLGIMKYSYQRRVEKLPDGSQKISESKTLGKHSWGTTTIISKEGVVRETKWAGNQTINGGFQQTSSETTTYVDKARAEQMKPLTDRAVKMICRHLLKAVATFTGDHKTRVEVDKIISEASGKTGTNLIEKRNNLTGEYSKGGVIERKDGTRIYISESGHKNRHITFKRAVETFLTGPRVGDAKSSVFLNRAAEGKLHVTGSTIERAGNKIIENLVNAMDIGDGRGMRSLQDLRPKVTTIETPAPPEAVPAAPTEVVSERIAALRESMAGDGCHLSAGQAEQAKAAEVARESRENITREMEQVAPPEPPRLAEREMEM